MKWYNRLPNIAVDFIEYRIEAFKNPNINTWIRFLYSLVWALVVGGGIFFSFSFTYNGFKLSGDSGSVSNSPTLLYIIVISMLALMLIQVILTFLVESKKQLFKITHIGLKSVNVGDIEDDLPWSLKQANINPIPIEYNSSNRKVNEEQLIEQIRELMSIPEQIRKNGRNEKNLNKKICYGGVAPTPMLMLAGYCLSNMQEVVTGDWDREKQKWYINSGYDDGETLSLTEVPTSVSDDKVINLCISLSYAISLEHVSEEFPDIPIFEVEIENIKLDSVKSLRKQKRISKEILEYISKVQRMYPNAKRLNIFCAAQASFNYNFGTYLNQAHLPEIAVFNYKRNTSDGEARHNYGVILSDEANPADMLIV